MFNRSCFSDGFALRSSITFPPSQFKLRSFSLGQGRPTFVNKLIHCGHVGLELRIAASHQGVHDRRPVGAESALKEEVAHRLHEGMRLFLTLQQIRQKLLCFMRTVTDHVEFVQAVHVWRARRSAQIRHFNLAHVPVRHGTEGDGVKCEPGEVLDGVNDVTGTKPDEIRLRNWVNHREALIGRNTKYLPLPLLNHLRRDVDHVVEHVAHLCGTERWHEQTVCTNRACQDTTEYPLDTSSTDVRAMPQFSSPGYACKIK